MLTARLAVIAAASIGVLLVGGFALWEHRRRRKRPAAAPTDSARPAATVRPLNHVARDLQQSDGTLNSKESTPANSTCLAGSDDTSSRKHVFTTVVQTSESLVQVPGADDKADDDAVNTVGFVHEELVASSHAQKCFSTADNVESMDRDVATESSVIEHEHAYCLHPGGAVKAVPDSSASDSVSFSSYDMLSSRNEWTIIEGAQDSVAQEEIVDSCGESRLTEGDCAGVCQEVPKHPDEYVTVSSSCEQAVHEASVSGSGDHSLLMSSCVLAESAANNLKRGTDADQLVTVTSFQSDHAGIVELKPSEHPASEGPVLSSVAPLDGHTAAMIHSYVGTIAAENDHLSVGAQSMQIDINDSASALPVPANLLPYAPDCKNTTSENSITTTCLPPAQGKMLSFESCESIAFDASNSIVYIDPLCASPECNKNGSATVHSCNAAAVVASAVAFQPPLGATTESAEDELVISICSDQVTAVFAESDFGTGAMKVEEAHDATSAVAVCSLETEEERSLSTNGSFEFIMAPSTAVVSSSSDSVNTADASASGSHYSSATDEVSHAPSVSSSSNSSACRATAATSDDNIVLAFYTVSSAEHSGSVTDSPDSTVSVRSDGDISPEQSAALGTAPTQGENVTEHLEATDELYCASNSAGDASCSSTVNGRAEPAAAADSSQSCDTEGSAQAPLPQSHDSVEALRANVQSNQTKQVGVEQVFNFYLPTTMCGLFIGKKGRNVNHLKAKSGAFIHVEALPTARDRHLCVIKGSAEAISKAVDAIVERFPELSEVLGAHACVASTPIGAGAVTAIDVNRLQLQLVPHSAVNVVLASMAGATRAFVQLPTHPTYPSLERLSATLLEVYSGATADEIPPPLPEPVAPGALCAVESDGVWYRGIVIQQCEQYGVAEIGVQLRYIDYGGYETVPIARVRLLRPDFLSLPFQAVECSLAHVKPRENTDSVSEANALSVLASFAGGLLECVNIGTDGDTGLPAVELYATSSGATIYINQLVADAGGMEWIH